jgi:hypothetical protein
MSTVQQEARAKESGKLSGWFKTLLGGLAGVVSGALVMYLSPLLDKVVKPAHPVANFAIEAQGLTVTVHNRSLGSGSGWWDFGDGSPLEPLDPNQQVLTHTYASAGDYTIKLALRSHFGEENDRSVPVRLERPREEPPVIEALEAVAVSPGSYAPATFRLSGKVQNAHVCVWDSGDGSPLDIVPDPAATQDRLVTFARPGDYVVKLAAVNSGKSAQKTQVVRVVPPPPDTVTAVLHVTEQATEVLQEQVNHVFTEAFPPERKEDVLPVNRIAPARPGYEIADVRWKGPDGKTQSLRDKGELAIDGKAAGVPSARNLRLQLAADRRWVRLSGELLRGKDSKAPPRLLLRVTLVQEKRTAVKRTVPVMATLTAPGTATVPLPPLPQGWTGMQRQLRLELREGDRAVWTGSDLPRAAVVTVRNRSCLLSAAPAGDKVRVDLADRQRGGLTLGQ